MEVLIDQPINGNIRLRNCSKYVELVQYNLYPSYINIGYEKIPELIQSLQYLLTNTPPTNG